VIWISFIEKHINVVLYDKLLLALDLPFVLTALDFFFLKIYMIVGERINKK
jgi:hypothetical protein